MFNRKGSNLIIPLLPLLTARFAHCTGESTTSALARPPVEGCSSVDGRLYNCEDGGWCHPNSLDETVWQCFTAAGVPINLSTLEDHDHDHEHGSEESGTCVVHGGHTHGDCSAQCSGIDTGEYNKGLHIGAIFIMLVGSAVGVFSPLLFPRNTTTKSRFNLLIFITKHFGTGVIICTALIHLLYHAFIMFNNACVSNRLKFKPIAPALVLAALLFTFVVDYALDRRIDKGSQSSPATADEKLSVETPSIGSSGHCLSSKQEIADVQLLEAGIIFHSIMIGVSLGATGGPGWIPLLCAIVFHQLFEGLGLGSRIAKLDFPNGGTLKKWLMGVAFALITPIGVAIGIGVRQSYNPNSVAALVAIGVLDAISGGILLYAGIVEMLVADFMHGELRNASVGKASSAFLLILLGALGMAVIGNWA